MTDGLELDLFDDATIGFRLQRFEVFNWGTFDGRVWSVTLDGRNGLLTGDIGSGKSTLVDGITTLLVPPGRISYNKAAGAEAKERTLASYVLGHYKAERSEVGEKAKPVALRTVGHYSVLLAVFTNEPLGQKVTLAQVFAFKDGSAQPGKTFVVADRALSIGADFSDFGSDIAGLRRRLRSGGAVVEDSYSRYAAEFRRRFGIEHKQALELFHQTVSMKSVGNLTDFVRTHMLEPSDVGAKIDALISHYEDLTRAHDAVLNAKRQVAALTPLVADLDAHDEVSVRAHESRLLRDGLHGYFAGRKSALLAQRIERLAAELERLQARQKSTATGHAAAQRAEVDLLTAISRNGGDRLGQLEQDVADAQLRRDKKRRTADDYARLCAALDLQPADSEDALLAQLIELEALVATTNDRRAEIGNELTELAVQLRDRRERLSVLDAELAGLANRDSNIDQGMVVIRDGLCQTLGIGPANLPFVGELVRVTDPAWEPAAERLLRSFGLSLLVPERHYREVSRWVDATNLRGRLVYYRVRAPRRDAGQPDARSLVHKLEVKPTGPFSDWLTAEVARRFDLVCARTQEEFAQASYAITKQGLIKTGGDRHEKDDRHAIGDRRRYVLGWDNAEKRRELAREQQQVQADLDRTTKRSGELQGEGRRLDLRVEQIAALRTRDDYTDLDWRAEVTRIEALSAEVEALRSASDVLVQLNARLDEARARQQELSTALSALDQEIGEVRTRRDQDTQDRESLQGDAAAVDERLAPALLELERTQVGDALSIKNCAKVERDLRDALQSKIDSADRALKTVAGRIVNAMGDFRRDWPLLSQDFDVAVEAGHEYRSLLQQLVTDDLPRFEENFKQQLNTNAIKNMVGFSNHLNVAMEAIRRRVGIINDSLRDIAYQPHTYIKLEQTITQDADIREFRAQLKACTEDAVTGSGDDHYSEAKFLQVKEIVGRLAGRPGRTEEDRRWTARVTDVRNWFAFAASERLASDDTEHEHYSDSGGKSGGQKEKLAYTILAASLAYQFGLVTGETHSRTFRFVVIDEAFGRGSDDSARFGLELFKRLDLQLLVVTPLQKIHIIEPYVSHVGFVHNEGGHTSKVQNLTIEQYRAGKHAVAQSVVAVPR